MFYNGFQSYEDRLKDKQFNYNEKVFQGKYKPANRYFQSEYGGAVW